MAETEAARRELRAALLGQLRYLIDEATALEAVVGRVPENLLEGRPLEGDLSIKELFGLLATLDEEVHTPRLAQVVAQAACAPEFAAVDAGALVRGDGWNDLGMPRILERVREARAGLVRAFEALPEEAWQRTVRSEREAHSVYEWARRITQHDAARLREVGHRLRESHMPAPRISRQS